MRTPPPESEVLSWFESLSNWGRWGPDDVLGTLNLITPEKRLEALRSVTDGLSVSCAWDIDGAPRADQRFGPPELTMLSTGRDAGPGAGGVADKLALVYHGYSVTHVDALSHVFWNGRMYNDRPAGLVTEAGAGEHDVANLRDGVVTRGMLLDVASVKNVAWLEPGEPVYPEDLEAAESAHGVRAGKGDVLLMRTGYGRKIRERGPDDVAEVGRAGWNAACLPWFHERGVAMIACDTAQDAHPSGYDQLRSPVHAVGIAAMGLWLLDNCDLETLARECRARARHDFLFVLAPLRWKGASGSPANPLAVF